MLKILNTVTLRGNNQGGAQHQCICLSYQYLFIIFVQVTQHTADMAQESDFHRFIH